MLLADGVRETLEDAEFFSEISRDTLFITVHDAMVFVTTTIHDAWEHVP